MDSEKEKQIKDNCSAYVMAYRNVEQKGKEVAALQASLDRATQEYDELSQGEQEASKILASAYDATDEKEEFDRIISPYLLNITKMQVGM